MSSPHPTWPIRRTLAAAVLLPAVGGWFLVVAGVPHSVASGGWLAALAGASVLGAAVLATYVPRAGRRPDLGCSPCAVMAGLTLVGASLALRSYGADLAGPLVASAVLSFGLTQRLGQPSACAAAPGAQPGPQPGPRILPPASGTIGEAEN